MNGTIARSRFHTVLVDYVTDPEASAEETLAAVEAAWTEYLETAPSG